MKRLLIVILLCMGMVLPLFGNTVDADVDKYASMVGIKQVVDNNVDITYTGTHYQDSKGIEQYEYTAKIYTVPVYTDSGTPVDCSWHYDIKSASYQIIDNIYSVSVTGNTVSTSYNGETMSWNPVVMVDSKEYTAQGNPNKPLANNSIKNSLGSSYGCNVLEWDYGVCIRRITATEGTLREEYIFNKNPEGTVWIKDNVVKSEGFIWAVTPYAYDNTGMPLEINEYKQIQASEFDKAVYPITIDPTVAYGTSPTELMSYGTVYATVHAQTTADYKLSSNVVGQVYNGETHQIIRQALLCDTSAIPDLAIVSSAYLSGYAYSYGVADYYVTSGTTSTYPHNPVVNGDYNWATIAHTTQYATASYSGAGTLNTTNFNAAGLAKIDKTGVSKFYIIQDNDWNSVPATYPVPGYDYIFWATSLYVTYVASVAPTVTTQAATYITKTSARLNGYLDSDGGEACNVSFLYALWNGSAWGTNSSTSNQSKTIGETWYEDLSSLSNGSTYRFMARATNSVGTGYGSWVNFSTSSVGYAPTNVSCIAGSNQIDLSWAKNQSSEVYIRYKIGSYPTSSTDGNIVPNQSGVNYAHTGLTSGTSYYYKMWGMDIGNLSTTNSTCMCTTTAGYTTNGTTPLPTTDTSGYFESPNGSILENNPLYPLGNLEADAIGVPHNTWWALVAMGILVVAGVFIYSRTRNLLMSMVAIIVCGVICSQMGLFPMWVMYIFGFAGIGFGWKELR